MESDHHAALLELMPEPYNVTNRKALTLRDFPESSRGNPVDVEKL
jgi:hypothetical protein